MRPVRWCEAHWRLQEARHSEYCIEQVFLKQVFGRSDFLSVVTFANCMYGTEP